MTFSEPSTTGILQRLAPKPPSPVPSTPLKAPTYMTNYFSWVMKAVGTVTLIASWLPATLADGKITIKEIVDLGVKIAAHFGVDVDTQGIDIHKL